MILAEDREREIEIWYFQRVSYQLWEGRDRWDRKESRGRRDAVGTKSDSSTREREREGLTTSSMVSQLTRRSGSEAWMA